MTKQQFHHRALDLRDPRLIAYTAMSKLAFCYRVQVSKFVLSNNCVPLNPFMNFDFGFHGLVPKDTLLLANNNMLRVADQVWMFGPVSDGALAELHLARDLGKPVRYFDISTTWDIKEIESSRAILEDDLDRSLLPRN